MQSVKRLSPFLLSFLFAGSAMAATYVVPPDEVLIKKADAIVVVRALKSHVEESKDRGIETVTVFAVEERLKGDTSVEREFTIRVPGGVIEEDGKPVRAKAVYGAPRFVEGEQVLLFGNRNPRGHYSVTDFGLGHFGFATDDLGNRVLIRAESEIHGWNMDGTPHREPRRDAEKFLRFIRDSVNARPTQNYTIEPRDIVGQSGSIQQTGRLRQVSNDCVGCTVKQYTMSFGAEEDNGGRWKTFPVNWNRGNTQPAASNNGIDAINTAFNTWRTGSSANYVLATANANTNGIYQAADGVNNVVFEKDMTGNGISAFSCVGGGVLGVAGVQSATSDATNTVNGEVFFRTIEGDASMNQGINGCFPAITDAFNSAVTHELGHSLGFRHSDKSRDNTQPCTNFMAYDCANSAIMTAFVTGGLNGLIIAWDQRAVAALYPGAAPLAAPTGVVATATTTTNVAISWNAVGGATTYEVHRSLANNAASFTQIASCNTAALSCNDATAAAGAAYLYKVRAGTTGTFSTPDLATTVIFTDPTITAGSSSIRAVHFTELRTAVNAVRTLAGQGAGVYTDGVLNSSVPVKRLHTIELRNTLDVARAALSLAAASYTDPAVTAAVTPIKKAHIDDLRNAVK